MAIERNLFDPKLLKFKSVRKRIDKWIKALRSGKYKQSREGRLYYPLNNSYCCLGVANEVCRLNEENAYYLTKKFKLLGLRDNKGSDSPYHSLAGRNDFGTSFCYLADLIEEHYTEALKWLSTQENSK